MTDESVDQAKSLLRAGYVAEARAMFERIAAGLAETHGPSHRKTLTALSDLAVALYHQGDFSAARTIQERVLRGRQALLGVSHDETLTAMSNLAWTLSAAGEYPQGISIFKSIYNRIRRSRGENDKFTWEAMENLAWALQVGGDLRGAGRLQEKVLQGRLKKFGPNAIETADVMETLGVTRYAQGRLAEARELHESALGILRRAGSADNQKVLATLGNLALTMFAQGDLFGAMERQAEISAAREQISGPEDPESLLAKVNLATTLRALGQFDRARALQEDVVRVRSRLWTKDNIHTLGAMGELAITLQAQGDTAGAEELCAETWGRRRRLLGDTHPHTLAAMVNFAEVISGRGRLQEARCLMAEAAELRKRISGSTHPETLLAMQGLATFIRREGNLLEAKRMQRRVLRLSEKVLGPNHPHTLASAAELGTILNQLNDIRGAAALYRESVERLRTTIGADHPETLAAMANLAEVLAKSKGATNELLSTVRSLLKQLVNPRITMTLVGAEVAEVTIKLISNAVQDGIKIRWRQPVAAMSRNWTESILLAHPTQAGGLWDLFTRVHGAWLRLCIVKAPTDVPVVLTALQGRETARAFMEELTAEQRRGTVSQGQESYLSILGRVRSKRLQLAVLMMSVQPTAGQADDGNMGWLSTTMSLRERRLIERRLLQEYDDLSAQLTELGEKLENDGDQLTSLFMSPQVDTKHLSETLDDHEALVLLFSSDFHDKVSYYAACMRRGARCRLIELTNFDHLVRSCEQVSDGARSGLFGRAMRGASPKSMSHVPNDICHAAQNIAEAVYRSLWEPLLQKFPLIETWYVATHDRLHNIPIGADRAFFLHPAKVRSFPGIALFSKQAFSRRSAPGTILHIDPAWEAAPIPMVEAEARLLPEILPNTVVSRGSETLLKLQDHAFIDYAFSVASHGVISDRLDQNSEATIVIDANADQKLDAATWLSIEARPSIAFLGTCVGARLDEAPGGEPFGLIGALLIHGCRNVIGSLAAVPDFYMPLVSGLFWQAYQDTADAYEALDHAKQSLRTGEWPSGFADIVRRAYEPTMRNVLVRIHGETIDKRRLVATVSGWPMSTEYQDHYFRNLDSSAVSRFDCDHCSSDRSHREFVASSLGLLIDGRKALPRNIIDHLCNWIQVFGRE